MAGLAHAAHDDAAAHVRQSLDGSAEGTVQLLCQRRQGGARMMQDTTRRLQIGLTCRVGGNSLGYGYGHQAARVEPDSRLGLAFRMCEGDATSENHAKFVADYEETARPDQASNSGKVRRLAAGDPG